MNYKAYKLLQEEGLEYSNGIRAKKTKRTGWCKSLNFHEMTKQQLIEYIRHIPYSWVENEKKK